MTIRISVITYLIKTYANFELAILIIIFFIISSCGGNKTETTSKGTITSKGTTTFLVEIGRDIENKETFSISSIADSVLYIPLETNNNCLISTIVELIVKKEYIFVRTERKEIFVFSREGQFLNRIGNRGNGPKEYRTIIHFDVDNEYVYILDYGQKIKKFKISGEYCNSIRLPKQASRILKLNTGDFLCYIPDSQFKNTQKNYSFLIINNQGDSLRTINTTKLRNYSKEKISSNYLQINFSINNNIAFKETFNDTLFCLNENTFSIDKFGVLDFGQHKMDLNMNYIDVINAKHNMRINRLIDLNNFLFIQYACQCVGNSSWHWAVYDKPNNYFFNLCDELKNEKIINDIDNRPSFIPFGITKNEMIGYSYAFESEGFTFKKDELIREVKSTDNPIIVIAKLKNN